MRVTVHMKHDKVEAMTEPTGHGNEDMTEQAKAASQNEAAPEAVQDDPSVALAREAAEMKDKLLRTLAEMENLRRRTEREVADARAYAITSFAREILDIADSLHRARETIPAEIKTSEEAGVKAFVDGVELTERSLLQTLEKHGVRRFDPKGEKFNPNFQQAMFEVPDDSVPTGTVVQVVQAGYMLGERVLRPALVGVAKGAPRAAKAPANGQSDSNNANGDA